jgi:hypothetical protein
LQLSGKESLDETLVFFVLSDKDDWEKSFIASLSLDRLLLASSKPVSTQRRLNSDDASLKNPPSPEVKPEGSKSPTEPFGEKISYDRNFITAMRAMQDFLLKPG